MKYYIEEIRYCGPNPQDEKYIDFDRFEITIAPPRTNLSGEIRVNGWLGTSNDVARYAHGAHESLAAAAGVVEHMLGHEFRRDPEPSEFHDVLAVYRLGRHEPISDEALGIWLQDVDVPADVDDADLIQQAEQLISELEDTGARASVVRVCECLETLRDNAREDLDN